MNREDLLAAIAAFAPRICGDSNARLLRASLRLLLCDTVDALGDVLPEWEQRHLLKAVELLRLNVRKSAKPGYANTRSYLVATLGCIELALAPWHERIYDKKQQLFKLMIKPESLNESMRSLAAEITLGDEDKSCWEKVLSDTEAFDKITESGRKVRMAVHLSVAKIEIASLMFLLLESERHRFT